MFDVPGSDIVDVIITEDCAKGLKPAQFVHRTKDVTPESEFENTYEDQEVSARSS